MNKIKCPKCGEIFQVDESTYSQILNQVRNEEFDEALNKEKERIEKEKETAIALLKAQTESKEKERTKNLEDEIRNLKNELEKQKLEAKADNATTISKKDMEIATLKQQLEEQKRTTDLKIEKAVLEKESTISQLRRDVEAEKNNGSEMLRAEEEKYREALEQKDLLIKDKDAQIAYLKDFKMKLSTKMVGESLEQHCVTEFNKIRMTAFPNAEFFKDNETPEGEKGDFIFRENDGDVELISIMFEMKNEMDTTQSKHKNSDFFAKLDRDRKTKKCEYAVLVSTLESDSDFYNAGIVDVSYDYPKMYVIRPQCFIAMITLLRNAAMASLKSKHELEAIRQENFDISEFANEFEKFKQNLDINTKRARNNFDTAIEELDKTITKLQRVRDELTKTSNNLRIANDKGQEMTIEKLGKNSKTLLEKYHKNN